MVFIGSKNYRKIVTVIYKSGYVDHVSEVASEGEENIILIAESEPEGEFERCWSTWDI